MTRLGVRGKEELWLCLTRADVCVVLQVYCPAILEESYPLSESGRYYVPPDAALDQYIKWVHQQQVQGGSVGAPAAGSGEQGVHQQQGRGSKGCTSSRVRGARGAPAAGSGEQGVHQGCGSGPIHQVGAPAAG